MLHMLSFTFEIRKHVSGSYEFGSLLGIVDANLVEASFIQLTEDSQTGDAVLMKPLA